MEGGVPRPSHRGLWLGLTLSVGVMVDAAGSGDGPGGPSWADRVWPTGRAAAATAHAPTDLLETTVTTLAEARNDKVRVQAALVLGRMRDPRGIPALTRALADRSAVVRAVAAQVLGDLRAESARPALEVATRDDNPLVRRHAAQALRQLLRTPPRHVLEVNPMGDRTRRASTALRERMRRAVVAELAPTPGHPWPESFTIDGAIRALDVKRVKLDVEVRCDVQLILSTHPGQAIVLMSSGEATVQRPRARFRSSMLLDMQNDALQHAVRAAAEELRGHLTSRASATTTPSPAGSPTDGH
jgi:hypothetical protein